MARTLGSKNKPKAPAKAVIAGKTETIKVLREHAANLEKQIHHVGEVCERAGDQINDLMADNEFYRKQINHLLALVNILAKGN